MGLVASLVHTSTLPTKARERFAVISSRVIEALGLSSSQTTPRVRAHDDDSLELGAYGWLHKLRRAALVANTDQPDRFNARLKPEAENRDPLVRASLMNWQHAELTEHVLQRVPSTHAAHAVSLNATAHLIHHEDHTGFYIPLEFQEPLWVRDPAADAEHEFTSVGSSFVLLRELSTVSAALKIPPEMSIHDELLIKLLEKPATRGLPWQSNPEAAFVALRLRYLAARSTTTGCAIAFE